MRLRESAAIFRGVWACSAYRATMEKCSNMSKRNTECKQTRKGKDVEVKKANTTQDLHRVTRECKELQVRREIEVKNEAAHIQSRITHTK